MIKVFKICYDVIMLTMIDSQAKYFTFDRREELMK